MVEDAMRTQVVVSAHGNGRAAFERHKKFWDAFGTETLPVIVQPSTDRMFEPMMEPSSEDEKERDLITVGLAEHNGPDSIKRLRTLFDALADRTWQRCIIHEYDSISLAPELPLGFGLFGNRKMN